MRTPAWLPLLLATACAGRTPAPAAPPAAPPARAAAAPPPVAAAPATPAPGKEEDAADLRFLTDLVQTRSFTLGRPVRPRFLSDGSQVLFLRASARSPVQSLFGFDVKTGTARELITPAEVLKGAEEKLGPEERARRERMRVSVAGFTAFDVSDDGKAALVTLSGRIYVVPIAGGQAVEVAAPDAKGRPPFDPRFSPDGRSVAFVRGDELWVVPATGGAPRSIARSPGGDKTVAQAEFVAAEEFDRFTGYWWSPDSASIAYEIADASKVEKLFVGDPADPTQDAGPVPYPRPGHPNVDVQLAIVPARGGKPTPVVWDRARFPYLAAVVWAEGGPLSLLVLTREQKDLALLAADRAGKTRTLVEEHDDAWVEFKPFSWLRDGSGLLWPSERSGDWQLELRGADGKKLRDLTPPGLGFRRVVHADLAKRELVVEAAAEPVDGRLWAVPLAGGEPRPLTPEDATVTAIYARDDGAYLLARSATDRIYDPEVHRADGSLAGVLPSVAEKSPLAPRVEIQKVGPAPGYWTYIVRPHDFDPKRKYPVIVHVYGGPAITTVHRTLNAFIEPQFLADHGFIVVGVDNKGTPGRGRAWERVLSGKLAEVPLDGQVAGLQALAEKEPAMDLARVGITGGSFGGFMAALAVLRRPDVYKAAVAVSAVTDWLEYDTAYTERYLGVPDLKAPELYEKNSLLASAKDLSRPLLIVHGTADDNVHLVHALKLVDALFRAGKPFELLPLAHTTHMPRQPQLMLRYYQRVFEFFRRNL